MAVFRKRVFTPLELVKRVGLAGLYLPFLIRGYLFPVTSRQLREKIMLAVTSVNDCRYCSWAHTHLALNNGVDLEEINGILSHGGYSAESESDAAAILFAQHYADTNGKVEEESLKALREFYSNQEIYEVRSYIHAIYIGNLAGNTFDGLLLRFKGDKIEGSSLLFEILCSIITSPVLIMIMIKARGDKKIGLDSL